VKKTTGRRNLWVLGSVLGMIGVIYVVSALGDAWARPHRMGKIPSSPLGCSACHVNTAGGGPRNSFGQDYQVLGIAASDRYTDELRARDSDGDGYTNDQEFSAGTHPGDAASKPTK
jgi:hypothetical protein